MNNPQNPTSLPDLLTADERSFVPKRERPRIIFSAVIRQMKRNPLVVAHMNAVLNHPRLDEIKSQSSMSAGEYEFMPTAEDVSDTVVDLVDHSGSELCELADNGFLFDPFYEAERVCDSLIDAASLLKELIVLERKRRGL